MEQLFDNYVSTRNVKDSTIALYKKTLVYIYKLVMGEQFITTLGVKTDDIFKKIDPTLKWTFDTARMEEVVKDKSISTQKTYYSILAPLLMFIDTQQSKSVSEIYQKRMMKLKEQITNKNKQQLLTKTSLNDNWISFKEIVSKFNGYIDNVGNGGLSIDNSNKINTAFIATAFLLLFVPRRPSALEHMKIITTMPFPDIDTLDTNYNYLLVNNPKKVRGMLVMNNYKTNKHLGQQIFQINNSLSKLLYYYMKSRVKVKDDYEYPYLLQKNIGNDLSREGYTASAISLLVKNFITNELKIPNISPTDLRTIFITDYYNEKTRYITDVEKMSFQLGNSPETFLNSYVKRDK